MTQIEHYTAPAAPAPVEPNVELDGWFSAFSNIVRLSDYIAETEFVPEAMRRKPAAVAAAILTGREMGIPPMTALRHIHIVKGKPGQSAELMRAQAMRAGHEIRFVETSDTRCVIEGRRRDESDWTRVAFSAAQAKTAGINLGGYAEDKLVARASSRLCRRKFADAISGLPTVDEIEDGVDEQAVAPIQASAQRLDTPPTPAPETVQRKRKPRRSAEPKAAAAPVAEPAGDEPPLPGDEPPVTDVAAMSVVAQHQKLAILLDEHGVTERADKLAYLTEQFGREFTSSKELTHAEASQLITFLAQPAAAEGGEQ
ncbi:hypothetical protein ACFVMC_00440 [Nocardia sp. NPDC127579]|uniref:hypothetical protein n=1 Tax=Nocardia sp. NPDC127579 TaxID=3345402 RepID=UPI00362E55C8